MTYDEIRQQIKNEALNKIIKAYHPEYGFKSDEYDDESYGEQLSWHIRCIINDMEVKLMYQKNLHKKLGLTVDK